jgi:hypothetical protein
LVLSDSQVTVVAPVVPLLNVATAATVVDWPTSRSVLAAETASAVTVGAAGGVGVGCVGPASLPQDDTETAKTTSGRTRRNTEDSFAEWPDVAEVTL